MALDRSLIGREMPGTSLLVSRSRLRMFAKAAGQTDPVYVDVDAAALAGHRDLPVPPTFFFGAELEQPDPFGHLAEFGVDLRAVLHGGQEFTYHAMAYAGDELSTSSKVVDVYDKKGGALQFLVTEITVANQHGDAVATMRNTLVVRQLSGVSA